jgi:hypothetical protein
MFCDAAIEHTTLELLKRIQALPELAATRLVGGTALAMQLGHRVSIDLDIFGEWDLACDLGAALRTVGNVQRPRASKDFRLQFFDVDGVKVDFVTYSRYPWLDPPICEDGVRLASERDIAAMKINAITNRGTRKDFVDLAFLLRRHSLSEMIEWYVAKYPDGHVALAARSLSYFADAEEMPLPLMLVPFDWDEAKDAIRRAVRELFVK